LTWAAPDVPRDSVRLAVVEVDSMLATDLALGGTARTPRLRIVHTLDVEARPERLELASVTPNPARGPVEFRIGLPSDGFMELLLYDVQGRQIAVLARGPFAAGWLSVRWSGKHDDATRANPGVYFVRLKANGQTLLKRFVWLR
jgi:hypothetical protein